MPQLERSLPSKPQVLYYDALGWLRLRHETSDFWVGDRYLTAETMGLREPPSGCSMVTAQITISLPYACENREISRRKKAGGRRQEAGGRRKKEEGRKI